MIFIAILSLILIWVHISSLRFIIKINTNQSFLDEAQKLENSLPEEMGGISLSSGPGLISLIIIITLNLIEIAYFVACVYFFGGLIIKVVSSIIVGYTLYSLIKFIPNMKKFYSKPSEYLKEKTAGYENILNLSITIIEILFCFYILIILIKKYWL